MKTSKHPKLANGQPAISCFHLPASEVVNRLNLAHERAASRATREYPHQPAKASQEAREIGRTLLWHTDFPNYLRVLVCDSELFRLTADLPDHLRTANGGQSLDFWDYGYVADVLREWLVSSPLRSEAMLLRRALAWVEERGSGLRDYDLE